MLSLRKILFILIIAFIPSFCISASLDNFHFNRISIEEGLTQSRVQCVLRDKQGMLWIGTKRGLNSFNQFDLKTYKYDRYNNNSLPDNFIRFIAEDKSSLLYISTNKGICTYDKIKKEYKPIMYEGKNFQAWSFYQYDDTIIFGGEKEMLYAYDCNKKRITPYTLPTNKEGRVYKIQPWIDGKLIFFAGKNSIQTFNPKTKEVSTFQLREKLNIRTIYVDSQYRLWISIYNEGVICYNKFGLLEQKINSKNSNLNNDMIFDFLEYENQLWMATDGGGINIYDYKTKKIISSIKSIPNDVNSMPCNSIYCMYKDYEDNIWLGSVNSGLLGIKKAYLKTYHKVPLNNNYGLSNRSIVSLFQENSNQLWIGTDGGGVNGYNIKTKKFTHYTATLNKKINSIVPYSKTLLLISCFNDGIYFFNKKNGKLSPANLLKKETIHKEFSYGDLVLLLSVGDDIFIFGHKIYVYNKLTRTTQIVNTPNIEVFRKAGLRTIEHSDSVAYLVGAKDIFKLSVKKKELSILLTLPRNVEVTTACKDSNGIIWIGTDAGLYKYDEKGKILTFVETTLLEDITHIAEGKKGRLWIGAQNMLFAYVIDENRFIMLGTPDGMSAANELICSFSPDIGRYLFMGGNTGLLRIDKSIQFKKSEIPKIELCDVFLDGVSILDKVKNNHLKIPWNHSSVSLKILVKGTDVFTKHMFKYYFSDDKNNFIKTYENELNIGKLQSAKQSIYVSCNTLNGKWTSPQNILIVSVSVPWWKNQWFIIGAFLFIIIIVFLFTKNRINQKGKKLKWEMKEYENKVYEEKVRFLININHEIRTPLTLIYAPLKRLIKKKEISESISNELKSILKQTLQIKNTIDMVLNIRKMESEENKLQLVKLHYNKWVEQNVELFCSELKEKDIELVYLFDNDITEITFDETKCKIVLSNFLMNALKFSPSYTKITIITEKRDGFIRTSVSDQGPGVEEENTEKLFTRFYQGQHEKGGSGIGLSHAKQLVDVQGGKIGVTNNPKSGATFFFELPILGMSVAKNISSIYKETDTVEMDLTNDNDINLKKYSILIAEDQTDLRLFLEKKLENYFHKVFSVNNGEAAIENIKKYSPDIVLSDVMMPQKNGLQLCKELKEDINISHIPVVLLTAYTDNQNTITGYKLGADAYLSKPFDLEVLISVLQNQLIKKENIRKKYLNGQLISIPDVTFSSADELFMVKLNKIIDSEIENPEFGVHDLMDKMAMSRTSLYDKLKEITGLGVNDYVNKIRLEVAINLLTTTDLSITEISERVGFYYQRHFSTLFKKKVGVTPSTYRKNALKNNICTEND